MTGFSAGSTTFFYYINKVVIKITHQGDQVIDTNHIMLQNATQASGNRTMAGGNANNSGLDNSYMTGNT